MALQMPGKTEIILFVLQQSTAQSQSALATEQQDGWPKFLDMPKNLIVQQPDRKLTKHCDPPTKLNVEIWLNYKMNWEGPIQC